MTFLAVVLSWYVVASALFTCVLLTGLASYRRGLGLLAIVLASAVFPLTWIVWSLQEQRSLRLGLRRAT